MNKGDKRKTYGSNRHTALYDASRTVNSDIKFVKATGAFQGFSKVWQSTDISDQTDSITVSM